jgi:DNA-binding LytR/AlgR family response regulator
MMLEPLVINQTEIIHVIQQNEILFCEADGCYSKIHLVNDEIITNSRPLSTLSIQLNGQFLRISQSIIVNKQHIRKILKKAKSIELIGEVHLSFSIKSGELLKHLSNHAIRDEKA